jgi:hypothetical protein
MARRDRDGDLGCFEKNDPLPRYPISIFLPIQLLQSQIATDIIASKENS